MGGATKRPHILRQDQRGQNIPYPGHQIGPQASGLIVFNEALQTPMTHGSDNHLLLVYGITVHFASALSPIELSYRPSSSLVSCPRRITNCLCQRAPRRGLIFSSTFLTLTVNEKYVHGVHLPWDRG